MQNMSCSELVAALSETISAAAVEAVKLQDEINKDYEEKDAAEAEMHEGARNKDEKKYRNSRLRFDMLIEYIDSQERELYRLQDGSLITPEERAAIRARMFAECNEIETAAALKIDDLLKEAARVKADLKTAIAERNRVLFMLHEAVRPKNADGSPRGPERYTDGIVTPYLNEIENLKTPAAAFFDVFVRNHRRK